MVYKSDSNIFYHLILMALFQASSLRHMYGPALLAQCVQTLWQYEVPGGTTTGFSRMMSNRTNQSSPPPLSDGGAVWIGLISDKRLSSCLLATPIILFFHVLVSVVVTSTSNVFLISGIITTRVAGTNRQRTE